MSRRGDASGSPDAESFERWSDEALMLRVASGDRLAFRHLAERHAKKTLAIARRIAANEADAEEILQEAMIIVWTSAPRWRPDATFLTWHYRVVFNLCMDRLRQRGFAPLDDAGDPPDPAPLASETLEKEQSQRLVTQAVSRLPARQRAALVLTYYEGMSNSETADVLGTSVSSVESLLVRAKKALRKELTSVLSAEEVGLHEPPPL
jgi:RNA polymerase sigma-70 factor (ECF subfamily)